MIESLLTVANYIEVMYKEWIIDHPALPIYR